MSLPTAWYNILPDVPFDLPPDLPSPTGTGARVSIHVPPTLIRQESARRRWVPIPDPVLERYCGWRPTPLRRAVFFERAIGTRSRIYVKYEGGNVSGSHKLNTAVAQAYYYWKAGAVRLTVGTGAGQWGTAIAAACLMFGLECRVFMVGSSLQDKPDRATLMRLLGAEVIASPSKQTEAGRRARRDDSAVTDSLGVALAEALEASHDPNVFFCTGSGENYALLHQTVIGLEARDQIEDLHDYPDVVIGALGGGSNLGGLAFPFLGSMLQGGPKVRCVSAEAKACPKLTRGRYAYDFTDASQTGRVQKMYTLGHTVRIPRLHAGGLRYHAASKLISALYEEKCIEAASFDQTSVFKTSVEFARTEGIVPAPESAHALHAAVVEASLADERGEPCSILVGVSGHGLLDLRAYKAYEEGSLSDVQLSDEMISIAMKDLPYQSR